MWGNSDYLICKAKSIFKITFKYTYLNLYSLKCDLVLLWRQSLWSQMLLSQRGMQIQHLISTYCCPKAFLLKNIFLIARGGLYCTNLILVIGYQIVYFQLKIHCQLQAHHSSHGNTENWSYCKWLYTVYLQRWQSVEFLTQNELNYPAVLSRAGI